MPPSGMPSRGMVKRKFQLSALQPLLMISQMMKRNRDDHDERRGQKDAEAEFLLDPFRIIVFSPGSERGRR